MDIILEEKQQKQIAEIKKILEKEIDDKITILNNLYVQNLELKNEELMLEEWLSKYI